MRWALSDSDVPVVETHNWDDCRLELEQSPASLMAWEVTSDNLEQIARRLRELPRSFPSAQAMVFGRPELRCAEWALREAGAIHFVSSPRNLTATARLVKRYLATRPERETRTENPASHERPWHD